MQSDYSTQHNACNGINLSAAMVVDMLSIQNTATPVRRNHQYVHYDAMQHIFYPICAASRDHVVNTKRVFHVDDDAIFDGNDGVLSGRLQSHGLYQNRAAMWIDLVLAFYAQQSGPIIRYYKRCLAIAFYIYRHAAF